jgi:signal transduction histidine kinase
VRTLLIVRDATARNRVERMKNEFVSTVSHELRTPLTSIRGALTLLDHSIGKTLEPKPLQLLTMAKSNSERLSLLIDDILSIEKIGSGSMDFQMADIDLAKVAMDAVEQNRAYAADLGIELILTAPDALPVTGDASRLLQALTNLISNAAKFSRKGGVVSVIAEPLDSKARISVADQGDGIPVEFRPRLFDRFSQAQGQRTSRSGTGLGLAITKAIVDRHGGTIDYETAIGAGTVFRIELPLAEKDEE